MSGVSLEGLYYSSRKLQHYKYSGVKTKVDALRFTTNYSKNLENSNSDFSKYSLIRNKFWTHWVQRMGPIYKLFYILSIKHIFCVRTRNVSLRRFFNAHKTYV